MTPPMDAERARATAELIREQIRGEPLPWYDSGWLRRYRSAWAYLNERHPDRLADLDALVSPLRTPATFTTRFLAQFLGPDRLLQLRQLIADVISRPVSIYERESFGRDIRHDIEGFTELQRELCDTVGSLVGEAVEPSYNFLSLYGPDGVCRPHMDAPSAKWTLDLCIDQTVEWPIHVSPVVPWPLDWDSRHNQRWAEHICESNSFDEFTMEPGDAVVFAGSSQWHYRDPIPRTNGAEARCTLLFLHYIPAGAAELVNQDTWPKTLGIDGLGPYCRDRSFQDRAIGFHGDRSA